MRVQKYRITVILLALSLSAAGAFTFFWTLRQRRPVVIMAHPGPIKEVPQERGGMYIPKNMHIHDALLAHTKSDEKTDKEQIILGAFPSEKQAQKALLHFITLAPDIFQNRTPTVEKIDSGRYQIVAQLSKAERQKVCQRIEAQGEEGCWDDN